ncbi:substrate-binding periplasmic protein [Dongshaea marina]|uniref:substrate-binding periplasmic protein n=1 Tax=Dongshaea marina TaxID=2047966 RepID=UPI000D3E49EF|nr:transporter substrate-binding domain-containing protein [Dongshaea marina]
MDMRLKQLILLLCSLLIALPGVSLAREIYLTSADYPPYFSKKLPQQGFITQQVKAAFKVMGYQVRLELYPWRRAFRVAQNGMADGMFTLWETEERKKWFYYSDPLPPSNILVFFKMRGLKVKFSSFKDLKPYSIGSVLGYSYPWEFKEANIDKQVFHSDPELIDALVAGKIQLALIDKLQGEYLLKTQHPLQAELFESMTPAVSVSPQHLVISKKAQDARKIIEDFNHGLQQLKENGALQQIFDSNKPISLLKAP